MCWDLLRSLGKTLEVPCVRMGWGWRGMCIPDRVISLLLSAVEAFERGEVTLGNGEGHNVKIKCTFNV